jgi:asparagine synthase (glutamine-hydrolysing)
LRGEFAFVLWDNNTQNLFAARDRFGIKRRYYAVDGFAQFLALKPKAWSRPVFLRAGMNKPISGANGLNTMPSRYT